MPPNRLASRSDKPRVLIAGAGIGGLTAALVLSRLGYKPTVFEAARVMEPIGVGICLDRRATATLASLGLGRLLRSRAMVLETALTSTPDGRTKAGDGVAVPTPGALLAHRALLHQTLFDAVRSRLGNRAIVTGARLETFAVHDGDLHVTLSDRMRDGTSIEIEADILIAADGFGSVARTVLYPDDPPPRPTGRIVWRGVTQCVPACGPGTFVTVSDGTDRLSCYPISRPDSRTGHALVSWIAEHRSAGPDDASAVSWNWSGNRDRVAGLFGHWRVGSLSAYDLIADAEKVLEHPVLTRQPLPSWAKGPVAVIGDAAHPQVAPSLTGTSDAMADAVALGRAIEIYGATAQALAAFDRARRCGADELGEMRVPRRPVGGGDSMPITLLHNLA